MVVSILCELLYIVYKTLHKPLHMTEQDKINRNLIFNPYGNDEINARSIIK